MNVIISGLTAAGKTTHSKILAEKFHLEYISATEALVDLSGLNRSDVTPSDSEFWISDQAAQINIRRQEGKQLDLAVDKQLTKLSETLNHAVFDAWGLAWISPAPALRIWLESSLESRLKKALVSHRFHKELTAEAILEIIKRKDEQTRALFLDLYSFDIYRDRDIFDLVIDLSSFIRKPHILSAKRSINLADQIITSFVGWYSEKKNYHRKIFNECLAQLGQDVLVRYPPDIVS